MVQGQASEEKLISSSKQVAASTAQLLLACKVKASPNSKAMQRLQVLAADVSFDEIVYLWSVLLGASLQQTTCEP